MLKSTIIKKAMPYTMVNKHRLRQLYNLAEKVEKEKIQGDFVEVGCFNGGACAVMGAVNKKYKTKRIIWYCDTFKGFTRKHDNDGTKGDLIGHSIGEMQNVFQVIKTLGLSVGKNLILKGDIKDTAHTILARKRPIAILRIDVNIYESCRDSLELLFPSVIQGGFVLLDDYDKWPGYKKAVDEYFKDTPSFVFNETNDLPRNVYRKS